MSFNKQNAEQTVKKLKRTDDLEVKEIQGGKHRIFQIFHNGNQLFQFGISHSSGKDHGHAHVFRQMLLKQNEALNFASCKLSNAKLIELLKQRGAI